MTLDGVRNPLHAESPTDCGESGDYLGTVSSGNIFGRKVTTVPIIFDGLHKCSPEDRLEFLCENVPGFNRQLFKADNGYIVTNQDAFCLSSQEEQEIEAITENQIQLLKEKITKIASAKMWFQVAAIISAIASSLFTLVSHLGLMAASLFVTPISVIGGISFAASFIVSMYEGSKIQELNEIATSLGNRRQQKNMEFFHALISAKDNFFNVFVNGQVLNA